jgi:mono/diheme cytochrome c family protein
MMILLAGCGSVATAPTNRPLTPAASSPTRVLSSDNASVSQGELVFNRTAGCNACHTVNGSSGLIGPDLAGVADRVVKMHPDLSVEQALEVEIVDPTAFVTEGYRGELMPANYKDTLTPQQIQDLIAYMMSLE